MSKITAPTVGRKVWYRPSEWDRAGANGMAVAAAPGSINGEPLDATVIAVWGDRMVNLLVTDITGKQCPRLSVTLVQPGDTPPTGSAYCEWMPYQKQQHAAQADAAQATDDHPIHAAIAGANATQG